MIEEAREVPRDKQTWHLSRLDQGDVLQGPGGLRSVLGSDVQALDDAGLIKGVAYNYLYGNDYVMTVEGRAHYAEVQRRKGEAVERQEDTLRRFLDSAAFREAYPAAYERWSEAEALLWAANSEREFTTVGHKCRESMQEFASEVVARYEPPDVEANPALVNRRLGATIAMFLPSLAKLRRCSWPWRLLRGRHGAIQRQEHGGRRKGTR